MHCAAVLWAFGETIRKSTFRRVPKGNKLLHEKVRDPRLSFVHFLVWNEEYRRPVEVQVCQATETTRELVGKCLSAKFTQVPAILRPYCTRRDGMTISKLEQEVCDMGKQLHLKQLEVLIFNIYLFIDICNIIHNFHLSYFVRIIMIESIHVLCL